MNQPDNDTHNAGMPSVDTSVGTGLNACDVPALTLDMDDLESLPRAMRRVQSFLREVGFTYVTISRVEPGDYSKWHYEEKVNTTTRH